MMSPRSVSLAKFLIAVLFSIYVISPVFGAKILFLVGNINSHVLYFARSAVDLAELGHVTRLVMPSNAHVPDFIQEAARSGSNGNFTYSRYSVAGAEPLVNSRFVSESLVKLDLSTSIWETFTVMYSFGHVIVDSWEDDCVRLLENDDEMRRIRDGGYQFAVVDHFVFHCYYAIPYSLGIPYATFTISYFPWVYRVPRLPSFFSTSLGYSDRMTFGQRLANFIVEMFQVQYLNQMSKRTNYVDRLTPGRPPLDMMQLMHQSSLWFFLEHIAVGYAYPQMPNTVAVGDIMAGRPGKVLPRDLEEFLSASKDGVMIASFGSFFDFVPPDVLSKFCNAFRDVRNPLRVVWKMKNTSVCAGNSHVKLMSWLPQNDLLADPRVRLFISHGGLNSVAESVYHVKPLIIFPIAFDQPTNAAAAQDKGYAIRMYLGNFSSDMLVCNIHQILTDPSYRRNAQLASDLLRDATDTPAQRMSAMIEHVIKYGDRHLRTGAFELSIFQFMMFDIFAVLFAMAIFVLVLALCISCCVCCRCYCNPKKLKND